MKKRYIIGTVIVSGILLVGVAGSNNNPKSSNFNASELKPETTTSQPNMLKVTTRPVCDGTTVTSSCTVNSISYKTYIYHPAVPEKSHTEPVTTYKKEITSYCTLCNDGTYSPSCATGRGACSYHGGVSQWNAPVYSNVPVYSTKIVIDAPAVAEYYEKVTE